MSKKSKKVKKRRRKKREKVRKPKKVLTTRETLRQIEREKRRKRIFFLVTLIVILVSIVVVTWYLASELTLTGTLVIHVIDEHTNNPISEATIAISGPYDATVQADQQGLYMFESIPAGTYTVTVSKEGYHAHPETASVKIGQTTHHTAKLHTHH